MKLSPALNTNITEPRENEKLTYMDSSNGNPYTKSVHKAREEKVFYCDLAWNNHYSETTPLVKMNLLTDHWNQSLKTQLAKIVGSKCSIAFRTSPTNDCFFNFCSWSNCYFFYFQVLFYHEFISKWVYWFWVMKHVFCVGIFFSFISFVVNCSA